MWLWIATYTLRMADGHVSITIKERDRCYTVVVVGPEGSNAQCFFTPIDTGEAVRTMARTLRTVGFELDRPIGTVWSTEPGLS